MVFSRVPRQPHRLDLLLPIGARLGLDSPHLMTPPNGLSPSIRTRSAHSANNCWKAPPDACRRATHASGTSRSNTDTGARRPSEYHVPPQWYPPARTASWHAMSLKYDGSQGSRRREQAASPIIATTVRVTLEDRFIAYPPNSSATLEAILQADFDHAHHVDIRQVVVADAGPVLVVQRDPGRVRVPRGKLLPAY